MTFLKIFVGTNKNAVVRYDIWINELEEKDEKRFNFYHMSTYNCKANINCIDFNDHFLAIGGDDNQIIVHNLNDNSADNKIETFLHKSPINAIKFSEDGHNLFAGFERGQLIVFKVDPLTIRKEWLIPHNGKPISTVSMHPGGKSAITIGNSKLIVWNISKVEQIHSMDTNDMIMGNNIETVEWSTNGLFYAIFGNREVLVMSLKAGTVEREHICSSAIKSICWLNNNELLLGQHNGIITYLKLNSQQVKEFAILDKIKNACKSKDDNVSFSQPIIKEITIYCNCFLLVLMTNGLLSLWRFSHQKCTLDLINYVNIGCRAVCMKVLNLNNKLPVTNEFNMYKETLVNVKSEPPTIPISSDVNMNEPCPEIEQEKNAASGVSKILENVSLNNINNDKENQLNICIRPSISIDNTIDDQNVNENVTSSDEHMTNSDDMETEDANEIISKSVANENTNSLVIPNDLLKQLPIFDADNDTQYFIDNSNISFYIGNMPVSEETFYSRANNISQKKSQLTSLSLSKQATINIPSAMTNDAFKVPLTQRLPPPRKYQNELYSDDSTDSQTEICDYERPKKIQTKRFWKKSKLSGSKQPITCPVEQPKSTQSKKDDPLKLPAVPQKIVQTTKDLDVTPFKLPAAPPTIVQSNKIVEITPFKSPVEQPKIIQSNKDIDTTLFKLPAAPPKNIQSHQNADITPLKFPFEQPFKLPAKKRKTMPFELPSAAPSQIIQSTLNLPSEQSKDVVPAETPKTLPNNLPNCLPEIIQNNKNADITPTILKLPSEQLKAVQSNKDKLPAKKTKTAPCTKPFELPAAPPKIIQSNGIATLKLPSEQAKDPMSAAPPKIIQSNQQSTKCSLNIASLSLNFVKEKLSASRSQENHQNQQLLQPVDNSNEQRKFMLRSIKNPKVIITCSNAINRKLQVKSSTVLAAQKITKKSFTRKRANSTTPSTTATPTSSANGNCLKLTPSNQIHNLHRPIGYNSDDDFQQTPEKRLLRVDDGTSASAAIKKRVNPKKSKLIKKQKITTNVDEYDFDADFVKPKKCAKIGSDSKIKKSNDADQNTGGPSKLMKLNGVDKITTKLPKSPTKAKIIDDEMTKSPSKLMKLNGVDKPTTKLPKSPTKAKMIDDSKIKKSNSIKLTTNDAQQNTDGQSKLMKLNGVDKTANNLLKSPTRTKIIDDEMTKSPSKLMKLNDVDKTTKNNLLKSSPTRTKIINDEMTKSQPKVMKLNGVDKTAKNLPKSPTKPKIIKQKSTGNTDNDDAKFKSPKRNLRSNHIEYDSDAKFDSPRTKLGKKNILRKII